MQSIHTNNVRARLSTVACILLICTIVLYIWPPLLALLVGSIASIEYHHITHSHHTIQTSVWNVVQYNIICISALNGEQYITTSLLCIICSRIVYELIVVTKSTKQTYAELCSILFGYIYVSYLFSHTVLLLQSVHKYNQYLTINTPIINQQYEITTIIFVVLSTANGENGALLIGSLFGKYSSRLATNISPHKSMIGCIAQVMSSMITAVLYTYCTSINPVNYTVFDGIILGVILGIFGMIGDLFESYIKRCHNRKDSNTIITLPGIGGVLDRIDGLIFNFVITYHYYKYRQFIT